MSYGFFVDGRRRLIYLKCVRTILLHCLAEATRARSETDFLHAMVTAFSRAVKADVHSLTHHTASDGKIGFWCPGEGKAGPDHWLPRLFAKLLAIETVIRPHPNTAAYLAHGPGAYLRSNLVGDKEWHRRPHYRLVDKPSGIDDMVCLFLTPSNDTLVTLHAASIGANFDAGILRAAHDFGSVANTMVAARGGFSRLAPANPPRLTKREHEILYWVAEGKRNAEIATILDLSANTVRNHLEKIFAKLGVETRTAAAAMLRDITA